MDRLYADVDAQTAEAARRFGLVEECWDAVVVEGRVRGASLILLPLREKVSPAG